MLFLALVALPVVRSRLGRPQARPLITAVARRFGVLGGGAWLLIALTGFGMLAERDIALGDLPDSDYGRRLLAKIGLLGVLGIAVAMHGLLQGPRVRSTESSGDEAGRRRWAMLGGVLDALMLVGTLAALWLAASLVA